MTDTANWPGHFFSPIQDTKLTIAVCVCSCLSLFLVAHVARRVNSRNNETS